MTTIVEEVKLDFQDVLLMPKRSVLSSRAQVTIERDHKFKHNKKARYNGVPVIVANMDTTGTIEMATALYPHKMSVALHKFYPEDVLVQFFKKGIAGYSFYTLGITDEDIQKFDRIQSALRQAGPANRGVPDESTIRLVCIDVANGYSRRFVSFVERFREKHPDIVIMAGNVVTPDMVYDLLERGADIVKIGIGSGAVCTTRRVTGVGYPQLSAIIECADAAHGAGGLICSDGGIICPGDIAKAFAAGADFVMSGSLFAGHDECSGKMQYKTLGTIKTGGQFVRHRRPVSMKFYGMSSTVAQDKYYGGKPNYRAGEGKVVEVPYKGPVVETAEEILGGLRSACTYVGAQHLKHLPKCATFIKVNRIMNTSLSQYDV